MPDKFTKDVRSGIMSKIRSKNTKPELTIRKILWSNGKRYRVHSNSIFGRPDISVKKKKLAIFIDGCFWHGCKQCSKTPQSNTRYWKMKFKRNIQRRKMIISRLTEEGWSVLQFWEHDINQNPQAVARKIENVW